ncbi:MAG: DnaJ domain-containing protein [Spirochaeta sp.]|nr:DnaJ domain-containing protein [Spirochaeta sp.]
MTSLEVLCEPPRSVLFGAAGPFGVALGFLVGFLVDHMRMRRTAGSMVARCFSGSTTVPTRQEAELATGLPLEVVAFIGLGVRVVVADGFVKDLHLGTLQRELRKRYPLIARSARQVESVMQEAVVLGTRIDPSRALRLVEAESPVVKAELFAALLRVALSDGAEISPVRIQQLEAIGTGLGLNSEDIRTMLRPLRSLNAEARAVLGVDSDIDLAGLRKIYRRLATEFHPDLAQELTADQQRMTNEAFLRIQEAYHTLSRELGGEDPH